MFPRRSRTWPGFPWRGGGGRGAPGRRPGGGCVVYRRGWSLSRSPALDLFRVRRRFSPAPFFSVNQNVLLHAGRCCGTGCVSPAGVAIHRRSPTGRALATGRIPPRCPPVLAVAAIELAVGGHPAPQSALSEFRVQRLLAAAVGNVTSTLPFRNGNARALLGKRPRRVRCPVADAGEKKGEKKRFNSCFLGVWQEGALSEPRALSTSAPPRSDPAPG